MPRPSELVLVLDCGTSSLKFSINEELGGEPLVSGHADCLGLPGASLVIKAGGSKITGSLDGETHDTALSAILGYFKSHDLFDSIAVVGHRVIHGGERSGSVLMTSSAQADSEAVSALTASYNPASMVGIRACTKRIPSIPQVAVFDVVFQQLMPATASTYAALRQRDRHKVVRLSGLHDTPHRYIARAAVTRLHQDRETFTTQPVSTAVKNGSNVGAV